MNLVNSVIREYEFQSRNLAEATFEREVDIALFNGFCLSDSAAMIDVFHRANVILGRRSWATILYDVCLLSGEGGRIASGSVVPCIEATRCMPLEKHNAWSRPLDLTSPQRQVGAFRIARAVFACSCASTLRLLQLEKRWTLSKQISERGLRAVSPKTLPPKDEMRFRRERVGTSISTAA